MPLPALTPANVATKLTALYALSDPALFLEADAIQLDFRDWVNDNFALTTDQGTYLTGINDRAVQYFGQQCSLGFRNRLAITLVYPAPPAPGIGKYVEEKNDVEVTVDKNGAMEVIGSITFTMIYRA